MKTNPYVGLRPFNRDETDLFFGRESYTDELLELLGDHKFIAVVGDSGCGKSSLVRTGLEAGLQAGLLSAAGTHWHIAEMRPTSAPFENLVDALLAPEALGDHYKKYFSKENCIRTEISEKLLRGSLSLHQLLDARPLPHQHKLLLVCDQFEEIFRYDNQMVAAAFVNLLLASSQAHPFGNQRLSDSIYVVITMRSEYLGKCALFSGLAQAVNQGIYLIPRLTRPQLREAIEEPAFMHDGAIEPLLIERLLADAENNPDQLPLLQHVLMRMWELVGDKHAPYLTLTLYEDVRIGGLKQALSVHADEIYNSLTEPQQQIAKFLFCHLIMISSHNFIESSDIRQPVKLAKVAQLANVPWQKVTPIIEAFRQPMHNFLTPVLPAKLTAESIIDISHESFIRHWQRFQQWLGEETESVGHYRRLRERALLHQAKKAVYLVEPELSIYSNWYKKTKPTALWADDYLGDFKITQRFLLKSRRWNFWRGITLNLLIAAVVVVSMGGYQYQKIQTKKIESINKKIEEEKKKTKQSLDMLYEVKDAFFTSENSPLLEEKFANLLKKNAENVAMWIYYGKSLEYQLKFEDAEWAYREAIKIKSESKWSWAIRSLADFLGQQNRWNDVANLYFKLTESRPNSAWIWNELAKSLEKQTKHAQATTAYRRAASIKKTSWNLNSLGESLRRERRFSEAINAFKEAIILNPKVVWSWSYLGRCLIEAQHYSTAEAIFAQALTNHPDNLNLLTNDLILAILQEDQTRIQQQLARLQPLLKINSPYYAVIPMLIFMNDPKEKEANVKKILKETSKTTWDFSLLQPSILRQNKKRQRQINQLIQQFK
jgi:cytochrome c-type biogenesis protein CcmH/NrfG